eukprot:COSAG05_NODE_481_length_9383_cov_6.957777_4_plen_87_part_00
MSARQALASCLMVVSAAAAVATCALLLFPDESEKAHEQRGWKRGHEKKSVMHRNKKYKKDIKIQLVSQWVFSMSFKITKVKLLFLG